MSFPKDRVHSAVGAVTAPVPSRAAGATLFREGIVPHHFADLDTIT